MITHILLLVLGIIVLIVGADKLVEGGSAFAFRMKVPNIVIGLTIVAFGTSAPELVVNVVSSLKGASDLALGNVIGSNIFNVLAILGVTAIIYPLSIKRNTYLMEIPMMILSAILVLVIFINNFWSAPQYFTISRAEGIILLIFFVFFMAYTVILTRTQKNEEIAIKNHSLGKSVFFMIIGLAGLIIGGKLLVDNAVNIATVLGIPQRIIAITIVSVGTSLPELATSVIAARKKNVDMAVGNVVGSNLFNTFLILGTSATIKPLHVTFESIWDVSLNLLASLLLLIFVFTGKGRKINRFEGSLMAGVYVAYIGYLIYKTL